MPHDMIHLLTRFKIGPRLAASFFALLLAMGALCALALSGLHELNDQLRFISADRLPRVERLVEVADNINKIARQTRNILLYDDLEKQTGWLGSIAKAREDNTRLWALIDPSIRVEEGRKMLAQAHKLGEVFDNDLATFLHHVKSGEMGEATDLLERSLRDSQLAYMKQVDEIKAREIARIGRTADDADALFQRSRLVVLAGGAALLAFGALLCWAITRSIVTPLRRAVRDAERIAAGDLSEPVKSRGSDEAAEMLRALGSMQQGLRGIVGEVRAGVASVATASQQIAQGNQDLSARTEEQASSLQQTAASVEQISGNVKNGAAHAHHVNQLAGEATTVARRGGELVERAVSQISQLEASSQRIADIVGVIDGIAFQTNLLALNAAVEAARAGEQGRGFAVVAGEVRLLAQRCTEAAREIKVLVIGSVDQVQDSSSLVRGTGAVMGEIVAQIQRVSAMVGQISDSSREQNQGIGEIHQSMDQLDEMTQRNAALAEESTAAAESLRLQAERLTRAVASFRLEA
ncbi:MAG: MCP four helix bundle domain-containing protein [Burkholderiales bacterium]|nr:MCP four helix bundle domain-containing protein [Burkholderiales bacterium]